MVNISPIANPVRGAISRENISVYAKYVVIMTLITGLLYTIQVKYFLRIELESSMYFLPLLTGMIFGFLVGKIQVVSNLHAKLAATDALTQIYNRQIFSNILEGEVHRASRYQRPFCLIMFDIDHFKKVNDTYGHLAGDRVLMGLAKLVKQLNRDSDIFARIGGEEFMILSIETDLEGARKHAERLRKAIEEFDFGGVGKVTCSFGVVRFRKDGDTANTLLKRVDDAMYQAKKTGRNKVVTELELNLESQPAEA
ncbi:MAG: GGDEF domain-containing protein [FCB group bacterium]|nr:GGDEF domain-containing protein [FCB group bacterium]